jgi:uncharacterized membrane protein SirB2
MTTAAPDRAVPRGRPGGRRFSPPLLKALTTAHVVSSVALLGAAATMLVLGLSAATAGDAAAAHTTYELMERLVRALAIPLSAAALLTGIALSLGTRWKLFRNGWVTAKLVLLIVVVALGAAGIGPWVDGLLDATGGAGASAAWQTGAERWRPVAAAAFDVAALGLATGLSIYKPRRRRGGGAGGAAPARRTGR